ncbi:hypothetical protein SLEP1_g53711 [Rubroshorea leprosula]|uniref:R13L1/DRL21-like LRR repeat region domain-containing protein n=1 Tax=Rubroshorea leprosula TaxID=152421 RepID=A0AAV5MCZ6_9ROSI|nr:hypothetical protein SLEP1_g53711 [Rubroshorea leprosula]
MHDLINDLAQNVAGEVCFHFEDNSGDKLPASIGKLRHLSFTRRQYDIFRRFEVFDPVKSLRTFIALPIDTSSSKACCYLSKDVLQELVAELRSLRVLCLSGYCIDKLPYSIGHLERLRYLNLSYTTIKQLPESVGSLLNLQTFLLRGCKELTKLPQGIENLINLLVLDLTDTEKLVEMPLRISNLKNLQILSKFIVGKDNQFGIKELKDLVHLTGEFCIMGLENVVNVRDARLANLMDKQCLDALDLKWSEFLDYQNEEDEMHVLEMLQPNKNLKKLRISFYGGKNFPSWLGDPSLTNVVEVKLHYCSRSTSLPSLGKLPSLRTVSIQGMNRVKKVGFEFYGDDFLSTKWTTDYLLQDLEIEECPSLTSFPRGILPTRLQRLKIRGCRDLQSLPEGIMQNGNSTNMSHLESLEIDDCPSLTCFPKGILPFSLKTLKISDCSKLEPLSEQLLHNNASLEYIGLWNYASLRYLPECLHCLAHLTELTISSCSALISFSETGLPPTLRTLEIYSCVNLKSLPERMQNVASLQYLTVCDCPRLMTFPKGDLPPQLLLLRILDCINLKEPMSEWNLDSLTSLKELNIAGAPNITSFPDENCLLPTSLSLIVIARLNNLESLSSALQNLTSLEELEVVDCPKLRHLPREGLPATLGRLCIRNCEHLKRKCLKKKGAHSTRIAHIPNVEIEW